MEEKKLGLGSVISTSVGLVIATSCLVSLGQGAGEVGIVFIGAMVVACLLNLTTIGSLSELNALMRSCTIYLSLHGTTPYDRIHGRRLPDLQYLILRSRSLYLCICNVTGDPAADPKYCIHGSHDDHRHGCEPPRC